MECVFWGFPMVFALLYLFPPLRVFETSYLKPLVDAIAPRIVQHHGPAAYTGRAVRGAPSLLVVAQPHEAREVIAA